MEKTFFLKNLKIWLRIFTYYILIVDFILGYVVLFSFSFFSTPEIHTLVEFLSAVFAFVAASILFARFYSAKNNFLLFLSVGFLGASFLDLYHVLSSSGFFTHWFPSFEDVLMHSSWFFSRIFLSFCFLMSFIKQDEDNPKSLCVNEHLVYMIAVSVVFLMFLFSAIFPFPDVYISSFFLHRPLDLLPGFFFLFSAIWYIKKLSWRENPFFHWLIVSLLAAGFGEILFISSSRFSYDLMFSLGHLAKLSSYFFVFIGIVIETSAVCRLKVADTLFRKHQSETLKKANTGMVEALKESQKKTCELVEKVKELEETKMASLNILEDLHEEKLKIARSKAKDEALLESIGEGIVAVDKQGVILIINSSAEEMLGFSNEAIIGNTWKKYIRVVDESGALLKKTLQPIELALQKGIPCTSIDYFCVRKNKNQFPVSITASPVVLDKEIVGAIMVFRDISHEKEIDRAKSEFVSLASHQLQTPLSIIGWFIEMLLSGDAGNITKEQREYLNEVFQGKTRMVELVNSLLNVSRLEMGTFSIEAKKIKIQDILKTTMKEFRPALLKKKLSLKSFISKKIPELNMDPNLLNIIFQNIISNAIKYTPEKGSISVFLELKNSKNISEPLHDKKYILFRVVDTGYGIPENQKAKIFTKLFRADNIKSLDTEGTGLGLYIVKSILDHTGGEIWFESKTNKGTVFYIKLPSEGMRPKKGSRALH